MSQCHCPEVDEMDVQNNIHKCCGGENPKITKKAKKTRVRKE